jgi:hypothetical protein
MNTPDYKEFQIGKVLFALVLPIQILIAYFFITEMGVHYWTITGFMAVNSSLILIYLMFYGMTTIISDDRITVLYGVGLIRKSIHIEKIVSVKSVENPWYNGLGIRIISNGMLYSINGTHAVELKFKNTSKVIRIGTKNSTQLKRKITKRMKG